MKDLQSRLVHGARPQRASGGYAVNPPVERLSTVLFDSLDALEDARRRRDQERLLSYGARGNPTAFALEDLVTELEGGYRTKLYPTGLAAAAQMLLAYLRPGDHLLVTDAVYGPIRRVAAELLEPLGIHVEFFPATAHDLDGRWRPNTRMVYTEVPGSGLYELCDLPALAQACQARDVLLAVDNTWGSGYLYRPLALGADISVMALTKYVGGHSDAMLGSVCTRESAWAPLSRASDTLGNTVSPDDAWLVLRGARTLGVRLAEHQRQATAVALWLQNRPEVARVFYPALPEHPDHELWQRDFHGCNGLLSFELRDADPQRFRAFVDGLRLFGLGASWGGFESLVMPVIFNERPAPWGIVGPVIRLHIGLEEASTLTEDLAAAWRASA